MPDKIIVKGLGIYAYHGVNPEEKQVGQNFEVDITAHTCIKKSGQTDNVDDTVSYAKIVKTAIRVISESSYNLLERVATRLAEQLIMDFNALEQVDILLKKPEAPIRAEFDYCAVEISRKRGDF